APRADDRRRGRTAPHRPQPEEFFGHFRRPRRLGAGIARHADGARREPGRRRRGLPRPGTIPRTPPAGAGGVRPTRMTTEAATWRRYWSWTITPLTATWRGRCWPSGPT